MIVEGTRHPRQALADVIDTLKDPRGIARHDADQFRQMLTEIVRPLVREELQKIGVNND